MTLLLADYVLLAFALAAVVLGAFRGLSGTLAFLVALAAAAATARFGWPNLGTANLPHWTWVKVALIVTGTLIVFGLVRVIVSKFVRFLLARPTDTLFGMASGIVIFLLVVYVWAYLGNRLQADFPALLESSNLVRSVSPYVG